MNLVLTNEYLKNNKLNTINIFLFSELNPNDAAHYGNRAACYKKLQDYEKALQDSKKAVELDPTNITVIIISIS